MPPTNETMEEIKKVLWKCVASIERVENLLTNNDLNNDKGLVAQVQELDKRTRTVETFIEVYEAHKTAQEKEINKAITKMGVYASIAGVILSIVLFIIQKK